MELMTLQKCFERAGNKFPFRVIFHRNIASGNSSSHPLKYSLTFYNRVERGWVPRESTCLDAGGQKIHYDWASYQAYELIIDKLKDCPHDRWNYDILMKKKCPCEEK